MTNAHVLPLYVQSQLADEYSGSDDDDQSVAYCPSSSPTVTSCGVLADTHYMDGGYPVTGACVAQNSGSNPSGVRASATCTNASIECFKSTGNLSGPVDDAESTSYCSNDHIMISCAPFSPWTAMDGAFIGTENVETAITPSTPCTARTDGTADEAAEGVYAQGLCCRYTQDDGYALNCVTKWGPTVDQGDTSAVGCESGCTVMGCSGYSGFPDSLADWYYNEDSAMCEATFFGLGGRAVATCCTLYKEPTESPTADPTIDPTIDPTTFPSSGPTHDPTLEPINNPTSDPTKDPTSHPTRQPSADPTSDPTVTPTRGPSNAPTNDPTWIPSMPTTLSPISFVCVELGALMN